MNNTILWYPLWKSKHGRTFAHATNEISATRWSLIRLGLWCSTPLSTIFSLHRGGRIYGSRKPPTCRQSLTNFSVINNLIHNIAMTPDIVLKFLTFDTDGQHSTWRYDKKDDCSFTNTHFPQNSIIPTACVWSLIFTPQTRTCSLYSELFNVTVFCVLNY
jgi:hypothetical protein